MKKNILTMAALLIASAAVFTACSSDDNIIEEKPVNPTEQVYTMTIQASKTTGDDVQTRGLYWNNPSTYDEIKVYWHEGEEVRVVQNGSVVGTLTSKESDNGETTLSGTLTGVTQDADLQFFLHADENCKMDYTGQHGGVVKQYDGDGNIEYNYDFAEATLTKTQFRLDTETGTITNMDNSVVTFTSCQAIVRFELFNSDGSANVYAKKLIISDANTGKIVKSIDGLTGEKTYGPLTYSPYAVTTSGQSCIFTVALNVGSDATIVLDAIDSEGNVYAYNRSHVTFEPGKYYKVKVKMTERTLKFIEQITPEDTYLKGWYVTEYGTVVKDYEESSRYAVVAYVGKVPGYFDNFLAISMHDCKTDGTEGREAYKNWREYTIDNSVGKYAASHPIRIGSTTYNTNTFDNYNGGNFQTFDWVANSTETASNTYDGAALKGWRIPTITDWRYILYGLCGSPVPTDPAGVANNDYLGTTNPLGILNASPGYGLDLSNDGNFYCTSSGVSGQTNYVWYLRFNTSKAPLVETGNNSGSHCYLRPVFAY